MTRPAIFIAAALTATAQGSPAPAVQAIVTPDTIGAEVKWLEAQIGPAFRVEGPRRTYRLNGCAFAVQDVGGKIEGFELPVSEACAFDLAAFMPNAEGLPKLADLTFASFDRAVASQVTYQADCLKLCGNAFDPSVYAAWQGGRADNMMSVTLGKRLVDDVSIDASMAWEKAMEAEGDDYLIDTKFNCDGKYNDAARTTLAPVKPDTIFLAAAPLGVSCQQ